MGAVAARLRRWQLLAGILLLYVVVIAVPLAAVSGVLRIVLLAGVIKLALGSTHRGSRGARAVLVVAVLLAVATAVTEFVGSRAAVDVVSHASIIVLILAAIFSLGWNLVGAGAEVDSASVTDVLCIYLLIAMLFAAVHSLCGAVIHPYLTGVPAPLRASDTLYFSVITITTVGYGDVVPACDLARAFAATEAIIGQLYLVSVVAVVVSRYRRHRPPA